jgi:hypothetical protein
LTPALSAHRTDQLSGSIRSRVESLDSALDQAREALSALRQAARSPATAAR